MQSGIPQWAVYPILVVFLAIVGAAWRLATKITRIDTNVELILTNHLPHIDSRLERLEERKPTHVRL